MSLIYKSLQQVSREETRRSGVPMPRHAPGAVGLTKRLVIFLTILLCVSVAGYGLIWWLHGELDRIGPQMEVKYQQPEDYLESEPVTVNATPAPAPEPVAPSTVIPLLSTPPKIAPPVQARVGIEDLARPTLELEQLFTQRAKLNQRIMDLDRQLALSWAHEDLTEFEALLAQLRQLAGPQGSLARKWEGALALRKGQFAYAEDIFAGLVHERRGGVSAGINLVQALLGQNKFDQARAEQQRLQRDYPDNAKVRELGLAMP